MASKRFEAPNCYQRALSLLDSFDASGNVESLFYAALELRLAIEARLLDYLRYQLPNRELGKEYQANVIRKILERHGPDWGPAKVELRFRRDPDPPFEGKWSYQPVSSEIVRIHGRLGGYLHATAFSALSSEEDPLGAPSGPGLSEMRGDLVDCAKSLQDFICGGMRGPFDLGEYIAAHSEYLEWLRTSSDDE